MTASFDMEKTSAFPVPVGLLRYPCLVVQASPEANEHGLQFILLGQEALIGRNPECTIYLKDPAVSRRHASLSVIRTDQGEPRVTVSNLSTPDVTTRVGGQQLEPMVPCMLRPGDRLQVGGTVLQYTIFEHELQLIAIRDDVKKLMQEAQYERALEGLTIFSKHRIIGGTRKTPIESITQSARYYEAQIYFVQGKWDRAVELLKRLAGSGSSDIQLGIKATFQLGILYVYQNNLEHAQKLVDQSWKAAEELKGYFQALHLCLKGMIDARRRDLSAAQRALREAERCLGSDSSTSTNLRIRIRLESAIANFYAEKNDAAMGALKPLCDYKPVDQTQHLMRAEALRYRGILHSLAAGNSSKQTSSSAVRWNFSRNSSGSSSSSRLRRAVLSTI